ncbi:hypothetical protein llap_13475 [Limosa lapponica baueri]|uniref:Uncharacterized protein n=1 Tax=Limosa lapponica baueri TaxID=1758121 RepID=A0A2I0TR07_LIMLA|nr:hypothetical protein llap_13475 [Limosa lapponica baueri]
MLSLWRPVMRKWNEAAQGKFRLDISKRFFTERIVSPWDRLSTEVVMTPSLSEFKEYLDDVPSHDLVSVHSKLLITVIYTDQYLLGCIVLHFWLNDVEIR